MSAPDTWPVPPDDTLSTEPAPTTPGPTALGASVPGRVAEGARPAAGGGMSCRNATADVVLVSTVVGAAAAGSVDAPPGLARAEVTASGPPVGPAGSAEG